MLVFVGTYTCLEPHSRGRAEGIHLLRLDPKSGKLAQVGIERGAVNPSFLAVAPDRRTLYAVNETPEIDGHEGGAVSAYAIDAVGSLRLLNCQPSKGADPCYVSVDAHGRTVFVANYSSGTVAAFPVGDEGELLPSSSVVRHDGRGPRRGRQDGPHAHLIRPDETGGFVLSTDLGTDRVMIYRLDSGASTLIPHDPSFVSIHAGAGPRHLAFHPAGRFVYVINELDSTMTACIWDSGSGALDPFQTVSTLPEGYDGENSCADVHVAPSGRFVYGSNRGHDSIVTYAIEAGTGRLSFVGHVSTMGQTPRGFGIDPDGAFLLVANQDSDTVVSFRLDRSRGLPTPTGLAVAVPSPVCVTFLA